MVRRLPPAAQLFLALAAVIGVVAGDQPARGAAPPTVFVAVSADVSMHAVAERIEAHGYTVRHALDDLHALEASGDAPDTATLASRLAAIPGVRYAEPVVAMRVSDNPADPLFTKQSGYLSAVNAQQAWDIEQGKPDIIVAVIDTGVDILHADLRANIVFNPAEIPNNAKDDDGNGCVDDVNGCAFVSDSSSGCENTTNGFVNDDVGHGTFVAGVLAAAANGTGIVGVARNVKIMPVKVLDCHGVGDSVATARGISYAVRNGARVINLSLGGLEEAQVVIDAVDEATRAGVLVVAAAGNDGTAGVAFPARVPAVLAVGAAAQSNPDRRAPFSSYGPEVDVVAVGENILGPIPASRCGQIFVCVPSAGPFASGNGTSFSTPQVSGLAALMLSVKRDLTPMQITDIIKESATALPPGDAPSWPGDGRINMLVALKAVQFNRPPGDICTIESVTDGERFTCVGGRRVRMLQAHTPALSECGGEWAKSASEFIFLTPGRTVYLRYDVNRVNPQGETLAAPIWRGADGADYNLAIVMVYVGLARAANVGAGNVLFHDWALSSERWASAAQWNMWAPGNAFNGARTCS